MKILIIEDDENKRIQLVNFLTGLKIEVETCRSLRSGLTCILTNQYDVVVTDMTMPTFDITMDDDGGRVQAYAGREILRYMERAEIKMPTVVVTQFESFGEGSEALALSELDQELARDHPLVYIGSVFYDTSSESWKDELATKILEIASNEKYENSNS